MIKKLIAIALIALTLGVAGCDTDANIASRNLSKKAELFEVNRRIVFYNAIQDTYILSVEGRCSVEFHSEKFAVVCKIGPHEFKKHYLGRSDNTLPFIEQLEDADVSTYRYKVIFKPSSIIPDVDMR